MSLISTSEIEDLIALRMSERRLVALLERLTPEVADAQTFESLIEIVRRTGVVAPVLDEECMDCCGTGGSGLPHFNVSTTVAFVLAAGGVRVIKFGNRAVTSASGSFDLLAQLGVPGEIPIETVFALAEDTGLAFLYAPQCYPALRELAPLRKKFGRRTLFNYIGPLLHPLRPKFRLLGVSHPSMQRMAAELLVRDPCTRRALVVRGADSSDELTPDGDSTMYDVTHGDLREIVRPGVARPPHAAGFRHTPEENVRIFNRLVSGEDAESPFFRTVRLNAGAGFFVAGKSATIDDGERYAEELLANGSVRARRDQFQRALRRFGF
jgi:anthranilate phosphoribosyltransferase